MYDEITYSEAENLARREADDVRSELSPEIDRLRSALEMGLTELHEQVNGIRAHLGELDERIRRLLS